MAAPYQRLSGAAESPTFRYRLAKWLTAVSLLAVVMMAGGSLVYRGNFFHISFSATHCFDSSSLWNTRCRKALLLVWDGRALP